MPRKYDEFGYNRQFKSNPCNRRDPFPRDHLPFIDDMSVLSEMYGNGLGHYGPEMPQPITSKPIQQTPVSKTPDTVKYAPGSQTERSHALIQSSAEKISKNIGGKISAKDIEFRIFEAVGAIIGATIGAEAGPGTAVYGGIGGVMEGHEAAEALNKAIAETRNMLYRKYDNKPTLQDPFGSP